MRELKELMEKEDESDYEELEWHAVDDGGSGGQHVEMEVEDAINPVEERAKAIQAAARKAHVLDDVPVSIKRSRVHQPFMARKAISVRGQEKQLEKELPWNAIPFEERELYIAAEEKQWKEHVQFEVVRALSLEESQKVIETVDPKRILNSRFLYKDKNHAKRKLDKQVPPKPKARLCVAGQWDPDLGHVEMSTDAPTVPRHAIILALQKGSSTRLASQRRGHQSRLLEWASCSKEFVLQAASSWNTFLAAWANHRGTEGGLRLVYEPKALVDEVVSRSVGT